MDILTEYTTMATITYDLPSPDNWMSEFICILDMPNTNPLYNKIAPILNNKEYEKVLERSIETEQKMTAEIAEFGSKIMTVLVDLVKEPAIWKMFVDEVPILEVSEKAEILEEFSTFYTSKKTKKQEKPPFFSDIPRYKMVNNVKVLAWEFVRPMLFHSDKMYNPRYDPQQSRGKAEEYCTIANAFSSGRNNMAKEFKENFKGLRDSAFLLSVDLVFAPNTKKNGLFKYEHEIEADKGKVEYEFEFDPAGDTIEERCLFKSKNAVRSPYEGKTFEEIMVVTMLPVYALARQFMTNSKGEFKSRFIYHVKKNGFFRNFSEYLTMIRVKPSDAIAAVDMAKMIEQSVVSAGGNVDNSIYHKLRNQLILEKKAIEDKKKRSKEVLMGKFDLYYKEYMTIIDTSNAFATKKTEENMKKFVFNINTYNKQKWESEGKKDKLVVLDVNMFDNILKKINWYYTIPNVYGVFDLKLKPSYTESSLIKPIRKEIETLLKYIEDKAHETSQSP